jgi:hypothetical protein
MQYISILDNLSFLPPKYAFFQIALFCTQDEEQVDCKFAEAARRESCETERKYCVQPRKQFDSKFIKSVDAQKENELKLELALEAKLERKKIEVEIFSSRDL